MTYQRHWSANNFKDKRELNAAPNSDKTNAEDKSGGPQRPRSGKSNRNLLFIELTKLASGSWQLCIHYKDGQQPMRQVFDERATAIDAYLNIWPSSRAL